MPRLRTALPLLLMLSAGQAANADIVANSPDGAWSILDKIPLTTAQQQPWIRPSICKPVVLNAKNLAITLAGAPLEFTAAARNPVIVWLPMPDGSFARFTVVESPIMEPGLAAQFPDIKTYLGQGIDDPAASVRFDVTPLGFHSQILSPNGAVYMDPYSRDDTSLYSVYYKRDYTKRADGWQCLTADNNARPIQPGGTDVPSGDTLRIYRLACACTGEYAAFFGGTVAAAQAAIVTAINRVNGVYEIENTVRLVLIANNSSVVYINATTDPFTNNNGSTMLGQNQTNMTTVIGAANYDIGHVFSTGGGGIATLNAVCSASNKARGVTGLGSPTGDPFYIDYVAHEMGHQFGSNHCFNSVTGSCAGNRSASHAYEPGSASTIMGYAGICGADDLQPHSDPYFLWHSHDEIRNFVAGGGATCGTTQATGNNWPTVSAGANFTIPISTPFTLTATGSDPNGDTVSFCWEERDLGAATTLAAADNGASPLMRSWTGTTSPSRTIPRLTNLLNNTFALGEKLPTTTRNLNWTVTARDNRAGAGGVNSANMTVAVSNTSGPFLVTAPNTAVVWAGNSSQTVTWNVANTTAAPVSCANVAILLSTDGGNTFPTTLAASVPNNGSASITVPNTATTLARVKVQAVGSIFFDISNVNFTITATAGVPNDNCANAIAVTNGTTAFSTVGATTDGPTEPNCNFCCGDTQVNQDIWYTYTATCTGTATISLCSGTSYDSKVTIYAGSGCPGAAGTAIACDDDFCTTAGPSQVSWPVASGSVYKIRVGGFTTATGSGTFTLSCTACYANCDASTIAPVLNVNDFSCFLNRYAANDPYANCDASTIAPVLNVNDFSCFLNRYAAGCP